MSIFRLFFSIFRLWIEYLSNLTMFDKYSIHNRIHSYRTYRLNYNLDIQDRKDNSNTIPTLYLCLISGQT